MQAKTVSGVAVPIGKNLAGVEDAARVQRPLDRAHGRDLGARAGKPELAPLGQADAMLGQLHAPGTPHIDFHTSGNPARDYDSRIIGVGGAGTMDGGGNLALIARSTEVRGQLNLADCPSSPAGLGHGALWCRGTVVNRVP